MLRPTKRPLVVLLVATAANVGAAQRNRDMACVDKLVPVINGLRTSVKAKACVKALLPDTPPTQLSFFDLPSNRAEVIRRIALLDECKTWYAEFQSTIRATKPPCMYWYTFDDGFDTATYNFTLTEYMTLIEWPVLDGFDEPTTKPVLFKPVNTMSSTAPTPSTSPPPATTIPSSTAPLAWSVVHVLIIAVVVVSAVC